MKPLRLLPLLVALAGLSGCDGDDELCFPNGVGSPAPPPGMILVGEETTLRLSPILVGGCRTEQPAPESFSVEVNDPDNQPVEHQSALGRPATGSSSIRFTPSKPGRHHVFAAFDPVGGIQQFDLYAAMDRSRDAQTLRLQQGCTTLELTQKGALVCDMDVLRDGAYVQRFANSTLAVAGDVVWVVNTSRIQRYVDTGTALTLTANLEFAQALPEAVHPGENELAMLSPSYVQRFVFNGTALSFMGSTAWSASSAPIVSGGPKALMVRTGDRLGVITRLGTSPPNTPVYQVCPYRLEAGLFTRAESCTTLNGVVVGYERGALWVGDPQPFTETDFTGLRYVQWTATGLAEQASLPLGFNLKLRTKPFQRRQTAVPAVSAELSALNSQQRGAVPVYSADRRAILLEYLGPELLEPHASVKLIWGAGFGSGPAGSTLIRVRPSAP